jgi:hypothetical protein
MAVVYTVKGQLNPWQTRHGLTSDQYQSVFDDLVGHGFRLKWVSGYTINNNPTFTCIFERRPSPAWVAHHGMTSTQYQQNFNTYVGQGYRLVLVNGYTVNDVDYYVALWDQSPSGPWVARHGLSSSEYQDAFNNHTSQGYRLTHVSGYAVGNEIRYASIWEQTNDGISWVSRHDLDSDGYQTAYDQYVGQGYRLVVVNGYQVAGVDYYAGIWIKSCSGLWVVRHGMTSTEYQTEFQNYNRQGYVLRVVNGYNLGQSDRIAAIWENMAMSGADTSVISNAVTAYMTNNSVAGLSLNITQNGQFVYFQGFGFADTDSGTIVTPNTFRILHIPDMQPHAAASISNRGFGPGSLTETNTASPARPASVRLREISIKLQELLVPSQPGSKSDAVEYLENIADAVSKTLARSH